MGFQTPQDTEDTFYDAFEEGDLEMMMSAWANDEQIVCIQPMRHPVSGRSAVRESWQEVFQSGPKMEIEVHHLDWIQGTDLAIHVVNEQLTLNGDRTHRPPPVVATNVYRKIGEVWAMVLHHTSPPPPPPMPPGMGIGMTPSPGFPGGIPR